MNGFLASPAQEFLLRQLKSYRVLSWTQVCDLLRRFGVSERAYVPILHQLVQFGLVKCEAGWYMLPDMKPSRGYQMAGALILRLFRAELPEVFPLLAPKVLAAVSEEKMLLTVWVARGHEYEIGMLTPPREMPTVTALLLEDAAQARLLHPPYPCLLVWQEENQLKIKKKEPDTHG